MKVLFDKNAKNPKNLDDARRNVYTLVLVWGLEIGLVAVCSAARSQNQMNFIFNLLSRPI